MGKASKIADKISRILHNTWMIKRVEQGWSHGPRLLKGQKKDPRIQEFDFISEEAQEEYDDMAYGIIEALCNGRELLSDLTELIMSGRG
jgi:hypothetical protein